MLFYVFSIVAVFVSIFGMEGRGTWSKNIAVIGGLLWFGTVAVVLFRSSFKEGAILLLLTIILGGAFQRILRPLLNPHGH